MIDISALLFSADGCTGYADAVLAALASATGVALAAPPLHVTRNVHGEPRGIGLPDHVALELRRIARWVPPPLAT